MGTFVKMPAVPFPNSKHLIPAPMTQTAQLRLSANADIQLLRQSPSIATANGSQMVMERIHAVAPLPAVTAMKTATAQVERQPAQARQFVSIAKPNMASLTAQIIILKRFLQRTQLLPQQETRSIGIVKIVRNTSLMQQVQTKLILMTR